MTGLEELLNDCAVIRTTFDTLELFPDQPELRAEMDRIITDARGNLLRRLDVCRADPDQRLGAFISQYGPAFRRLFRTAATTGLPRRQLDHLMKVSVFEAVTANDSPGEGDGGIQSRFRYRLHSEQRNERIVELSPEVLIPYLLVDLAETVQEDRAYRDKAVFDRVVYQKYEALLYLFLAAEDPMFRSAAGE